MNFKKNIILSKSVAQLFCLLLFGLNVVAQKTILTVPTGHLSSPNLISVSKDGHWMASADDKHLIIWNALSGAQLRNISFSSKIMSVSWFPDNKTVALMTENYPNDSVIRIDISNGLRVGKTFSVKDAYRMKVGKDGQYYLISGFQQSMKIFDVETFKEIQHISPDNKKLQLSIFTTPDEKFCVGVNFNKISVNNLEPLTGGNSKKAREIFKAAPPFGEIRRFGFSPDSKKLVTLVGPEFGIVCFDALQGNVSWSVKSDRSFDDFGFSADGQAIITLHEDAIEMYSLETGVKTGKTIKLPKSYGTDMIVDGGMAYVWDEWHNEFRITRYNPLTGYADKIFQGEYQDGFYGAVSSNSPVFGQFGSKSPVRIWNFEISKLVQYISVGTKDKCIGLSSDGNLIAYGNPLNIRDIKSGNELMRFPFDDFYSPNSVTFSPSNTFVSAWENGSFNVSVYNIKSKRFLWKTETQKPACTSFSPDEKLMAIGYELGTIKVYNSETGMLISTVNFPGGNNYSIAGMAFTDNSTFIAACGKEIIGFDALRGSIKNRIYSFQEEKESFINYFSLSSDGKTALIKPENSYTKLRIISLTNGQKINDIQNSNSGFQFAGFISGGQFVVTTGSDDMTLLWNVNSGKKAAKLYSYNNNWLAVTPEGRFDGSDDAIANLYFTRGTDILPLQSLYEKYFTPRLLSRILQGENFEPVADIDHISQLPTVKISYINTRNLEVGDDIASYENTTGQAELTVYAECKESTIDEIRLFHNGKIIPGLQRNLVIEDDLKNSLVKKYTVRLLPGENLFSAIAINKERTESNPDVISVFYRKQAADNSDNGRNNTIYSSDIAEIESTAKLYLIIIGINKYKNPQMQLNYAIADAQSFKSEMEKDAKTVINEFETFFICDNEANKDKIVSAFNAVKNKSKPEDVFVFYYAGHGVISSDKEFYLVPFDVANLKNAVQELADKGIPAAILQQYASDIKAQKQVFILDACQSEGAFKDNLVYNANQQKKLSLVARSTGTHWIAASGAQQFATEFSQLGHGTFTYVLLEALKGSAAKNNLITVNSLKNYLEAVVPEVIRKFSGTAQYPVSFGFGSDFPVEKLK